MKMTRVGVLLVAVLVALGGHAQADDVTPKGDTPVVVHAAADSHSQRVGTLPPGQPARVLNDVSRWWQVRGARRRQQARDRGGRHNRRWGRGHGRRIGSARWRGLEHVCRLSDVRGGDLCL